MAVKYIDGQYYEEVAVTAARNRALPIEPITGLEIPPHDHITMGYTGGNLTSVIYRSGGGGGEVVGQLALSYDGNNNLLSITKS